jgi:hypothetical protein
MRYYIYLDRDFLKDLVSVLDNKDFGLEFVEYILQDTYSNTNAGYVRPFFENLTENGKQFDIENEDKLEIKKRDVCISKDNVTVSLDKAHTTSKIIQRRYTNIEDITDIKNKGFYDNLIKKIFYSNNRENNRISFDFGYVEKTDENTRNEYDSKHRIFKLNSNYIWYDESKLKSDMNFICDVFDKVNVISYDINENKQRGTKISKAIAIFIE